MPILHPRPPHRPSSPEFFTLNPLPKLLHTPSGLALVELQGTINTPLVALNSDGTVDRKQLQNAEDTQIGRLVFPDWNPNAPDPDDKSWMKTVHLYVGMYQRLAGEVKMLPSAIAIVRRREGGSNKADESGDGDVEMSGEGGDNAEPVELEIADIVKHKLVFSKRPEPVRTG